MEVPVSAVDKAALREAICHAGHRAFQAGLVAANDGNISVRCGDGHYLITPSGVSKGDLTPDMILEIDGAGMPVDGKGKPSVETKMHLGIYETQPDLNAVVHTHAPHCVLLSTMETMLTAPLTADAVVLLGNVPVLPYAQLGTQALADGVAQASADYNAALLQNHGAVTWGRTIQEAWFAMEALEQYCRQLYMQRLLGNPGRLLTRAEADGLVAVRKGRGVTRGGDHMPPEA